MSSERPDVFGRRGLPEHLERSRAAFAGSIGPLEGAKAALAEVAPTTRYAGRPLADALFEFESGLREARASLPSWRVEEVEQEWAACAAGLDEALARAERLRIEVEPPEGFEALIATLDALLAPLEAFEAAEERFRSLRRRAGSLRGRGEERRRRRGP
jgi:hypothetical protein